MTPSEFQRIARKALRDCFPQHFVFGNVCFKSHDHGDEFPSIPITFTDELITLLNRQRNQHKGNSFVRKVDYAVIDPRSIRRLYVKRKAFQFEHGMTPTGEGCREVLQRLDLTSQFLNPKGQFYNISVFDESVPVEIEARWDADHREWKSKNAAIILSRGERITAVADAKHYTRPVPGKELNKLILDASMGGAERCLIVTPLSTPETEGQKARWNLSEIFRDTECRILDVGAYHMPELLLTPDARKACADTLTSKMTMLGSHIG